MSRISLIDEADLPDDLRRLMGRRAGEFVRAFAHQPDLLRSFLAFYNPLRDTGLLDPVLKETVRIRIAQLNGCRF